ncbi:MAG: hypothetical protein Q8M92_08500 [Candidatus Subteraquimicrobiales bacterium]|nr:hypothetical protein [Candidatus Subteraquimicrobiales bacterium]
MYTQKEKVRVVICTSLYRIEGDMYILQGSRLTDMVNVKVKDFFPITDAKILSPTEDKVLYTVPYVAVNREDIIMIFPFGESESLPESGGE